MKFEQPKLSKARPINPPEGMKSLGSLDCVAEGAMNTRDFAGGWDISVYTCTTTPKDNQVLTAARSDETPLLMREQKDVYLLLSRAGAPVAFLSKKFSAEEDLKIARLWGDLQYSDNRQFVAAMELIAISKSRSELRPLLEGIGLEMTHVLKNPAGELDNERSLQQANAIIVLAALEGQGVLLENPSYIENCGQNALHVFGLLAHSYGSGNIQLKGTLSKFAETALGWVSYPSGATDYQIFEHQAQGISVLAALREMGISDDENSHILDCGITKVPVTGLLLRSFSNGSKHLQRTLEIAASEALEAYKAIAGSREESDVKEQVGLLSMIAGISKAGIKADVEGATGVPNEIRFFLVGYLVAQYRTGHAYLKEMLQSFGKGIVSEIENPQGNSETEKEEYRKRRIQLVFSIVTSGIEVEGISIRPVEG